MGYLKKFINVILVIINILLILNIGSIGVLSNKYIEKEVSRISINDILYSSKFDNNYKVIKVRKNINILTKACDILDIDSSKIDSIIDSDISKSIVTKISINMKNSLKYNNNYPLFDINDYNRLVDENIDNIISDDLPIIGNEGQKIVSESIKKVGYKVIEDIPDTNSVTKGIPSYRRNIIYILSNEDIRSLLIILDIIFIIILIMLNKSLKVLLELSKVILISCLFLILINILLFKYSSSFNNEWLFIGRCLTYYNYSIIYGEVIYIFISLVLIFIYKIIKRTIN